MAFNINDFQGALNNSGVSKLAHFEARVFTPPSIGNNTQGLSMRITSIPVPGRTVRQSEFFMYGPEQKIATFVNYTDIQTTIILSEDLRERDLFLQWQDLMIGNHREERRYRNGMFDQGYYDEYVGTLEVEVFNEAGRQRKLTIFEEAYPAGVSDIQYDWASPELAMLNVTWSFNRFYERGLSYEDFNDFEG